MRARPGTERADAPAQSGSYEHHGDLPGPGDAGPTRHHSLHGLSRRLSQRVDRDGRGGPRSAAAAAATTTASDFQVRIPGVIASPSHAAERQSMAEW